MILQALTDYYRVLEQAGKIDAPGWAPVKVQAATITTAVRSPTAVIASIRGCRAISPMRSRRPPDPLRIVVAVCKSPAGEPLAATRSTRVRP